MSLKIISRPGTKMLYLTGTIRGQRIRERTGTSDKYRAEEYKAKREAELWKESIYGIKSVITFAHAVTAYLEAEPRSQSTKSCLSKLLDVFGEKLLLEISQTALDDAYKRILRDGAGAKPATKIRSVLTPLRAVLEFAAIRKWCERPAFYMPKVPQTRTIFLKPAQVVALIENAAPHLQPLLIFLVGTGARMSEAIELDWKNVDLKGRRAVLWQKQGNERHADLPPVVIEALLQLPWRNGRLFRPWQHGRFRESYYDTGRNSGGQIKTAWATACRKANLPGHERVWVPKGQKRERRVFVPEVTPHGLRHTWATWHYCLHHDLIGLKEDGGWSTITMVTRYAKKMPAIYQDEIRAWLAGKDSWHKIDAIT